MAAFQPGHPSRALQAWQILIGAAHNRQTVTYTILSEIVGFEGAGVWAHILGHVAFYCLQNHLPALTVLVVNQDTGIPGTGIPLSPEANGDVNRERERVYNTHWYRIQPPTMAELAQAYQRGVQGGVAAEPTAPDPVAP